VAELQLSSAGGEEGFRAVAQTEAAELTGEGERHQNRLVFRCRPEDELKLGLFKLPADADMEQQGFAKMEVRRLLEAGHQRETEHPLYADDPDLDERLNRSRVSVSVGCRLLDVGYLGGVGGVGMGAEAALGPGDVPIEASVKGQPYRLEVRVAGRRLFPRSTNKKGDLNPLIIVSRRAADGPRSFTPVAHTEHLRGAGAEVVFTTSLQLHGDKSDEFMFTLYDCADRQSRYSSRDAVGRVIVTLGQLLSYTSQSAGWCRERAFLVSSDDGILKATLARRRTALTLEARVLAGALPPSGEALRKGANRGANGVHAAAGGDAAGGQGGSVATPSSGRQPKGRPVLVEFGLGARDLVETDVQTKGTCATVHVQNWRTGEWDYMGRSELGQGLSPQFRTKFHVHAYESQQVQIALYAVDEDDEELREVQRVGSMVAKLRHFVVHRRHTAGVRSLENPARDQRLLEARTRVEVVSKLMDRLEKAGPAGGGQMAGAGDSSDFSPDDEEGEQDDEDGEEGMSYTETGATGSSSTEDGSSSGGDDREDAHGELASPRAQIGQSHRPSIFERIGRVLRPGQAQDRERRTREDEVRRRQQQQRSGFLQQAAQLGFPERRSVSVKVRIAAQRLVSQERSRDLNAALVAYLSAPGSQQLRAVGQTEVKKGSASVSWARVLELAAETEQDLVLMVYDVPQTKRRMSEQDCIGMCRLSVAQLLILARDGQAFPVPLTHATNRTIDRGLKQNAAQLVLSVQATPDPADREMDSIDRGQARLLPRTSVTSRRNDGQERIRTRDEMPFRR
jgi:hypothetical protein